MQGFCKILRRKLRLRGSLLSVLFQFLGGWEGERGWSGGGRLFEFEWEWEWEESVVGMGANSRLGAYSNKYGTTN